MSKSYTKRRKPAVPKSRAIEALYYVALVVVCFPQYVGIAGKAFVAGGALLFIGVTTFALMLRAQVRFPKAFYYIVFINVFANLSQVVANGQLPIIGSGLPELVHWGTFALLFFMLTQERATEERVLLVTGAFVFIAASIGGVETVHYGRERLSLENVGGLFANSNQLAYTAGLFSVASLFASLRSTLVRRVLFWVIAAALATVMIRTLSRGGIAAFSAGSLAIFWAMLFTRGRRAAGIFALLIVLIGGGFLVVNQYSEQVGNVAQRIEEGSARDRLGVYTADLLGDLGSSLILGRGPERALTSQGVSAHNSFIYTHMVFGGPAGIALLVWVIALSIGLLRYLWMSNVPLDRRLAVATLFGMAFVSLMFSNKGYLLLSSIYAMVKVDFVLGLRKKRQRRPAISASERAS